MKLLLFFAIVNLITANQVIEGIYLNDSKDNQIELLLEKGYINVRINRSSQYKAFYIDNYNNYIANDGDMIKVENGGIIRYRRRRSNVIITLRLSSTYQNNHNPTLKIYDFENRLILEKDQLSWLDGNWKSINPSHELVIFNSRDGLKAQISGQNNWKTFNLKERENYFEDQKGNIYWFESKIKGYWQSKTGNLIIEIEKQTF